MSFTNPTLPFQQDVVPQCNTTSNILPQVNANMNGGPTNANKPIENVTSSSSPDKLIINSVYSLAEANDCSSSKSMHNFQTPSVSNQNVAGNNLPLLFFLPAPSDCLIKSILNSPPTPLERPILETNVGKAGTPLPMSVLETNAVKDSLPNAGPPPLISILETNVVKDSLYKAGPPPLKSSLAGPPPLKSSLETNVMQDSFYHLGPPPPYNAQLHPQICVLDYDANKHSFNDGSNPPAASSSHEIHLSSSEATSSSSAPEPPQTDIGSSLPEVVDVEEEDVDDCMVVKIDLTNCQFPIGKRINNLELVIDDSEDEADRGSSESNIAHQAGRAKSKKVKNKNKRSASKVDSPKKNSVKAKRKTKPTVTKDQDSQKDSFHSADISGPENISDTLSTSAKSPSCSNDENESFCPRIVKVEDNYNLNETSTENETQFTGAQDEGPSSGVLNQIGDEDGNIVPSSTAETIEEGKSMPGGVSAENSKNISCKACSVTFSTRLELVNHMLSIHRPKQNQNSLADDLNKAPPSTITDSENVCHSEVNECKQELLDSVVNSHTATQSKSDFHLVDNEHRQIISSDNPSDKSTDEPVVYTDSAVTDPDDDPVNPAINSAAPTEADNGTNNANLIVPPLCVRCECCCKWFSNYSRLLEHLKVEAQCKKFQDELFKKQYAPQSSRSGVSGNKPNITCASCKRKFASKAMLKRHLNDSPQCKKKVKKTGKSTASKKLPEKSLLEDSKKRTSASESTVIKTNSTATAKVVTTSTSTANSQTAYNQAATKTASTSNAQAVNKTTTTTPVVRTINSESPGKDSLTCKVCKTVFKDEIMLAKHLQTSQVCLKPKELQQKKTNFQFRVQLSGYSDNEVLTQETNVQALNKPIVQQEKNSESIRTKFLGQQGAPVTSSQPVLYQEPKFILSQPLVKRVEPVQIRLNENFVVTAASSQPAANLFGTTASSQPAANLFGITASSPPAANLFGTTASSQPAANLFGITASSQPAANLFGTTALSQPAANLFGTTASSQPAVNLFGTTASSQPAVNLFGTTASSQPAANLFSPTASSQSAVTFFGTTISSQQAAPVTLYKPVLSQGLTSILPKPPEQRVEPVQTFFVTTASSLPATRVTSIKPLVHQEPIAIVHKPAEERVEPGQIKAKEIFFGSAPLFSDTDGSESASDENNGDSSSSNEDAVVEYKCKHCNNAFTHKSDFKKHLKSHKKDHNVTKIYCKVCKKKFKDNTGLQAHLLQRKICFLHVTRAYSDSFEKGNNICQMCKKSLPSSLEFSKHCYKSLTCRLRYIDLVLQNIKSAEGGSPSAPAPNFSVSWCDNAKANTQASSSHNENSISPGGVPAVVSNTQDNALLSNNINPNNNYSTMQDKMDPAIQSSLVERSASSIHNSPMQHRVTVRSTSSPHTNQDRRCHCCNAPYVQFDQHIVSSKQCLIYYDTRPEIQPVNTKFCFKCRRRFKNNMACSKHFCSVYHYECMECGLRYVSESALKAHLKHMHRDSTLNAPGQPVKSRSNATVSKSNSNETFSLPTSSFNCLICFTQFPTLILLMEHSYIHTEEIPFVCTRCNTTFHHYNRYVSHQAYHMRMDKDFGPISQDSVMVKGITNSPSNPIVPNSGPPQLKIEIGETAKDSAKKLGNDQSKTNTYTCYVCTNTFSEFETYKAHVSLHSKASYISCTVCFENFPSQKALKEHSKHHEMSKTSKKNDKTNNPNLLNQNEKKTCTCLFCHMVFTGQKNKVDHLAQSISCKSIMSYTLEKQFFVHPSTNQKTPFKPNQCVFCDEHFPDVFDHIIQTSCLILFEAGVIKYRSDSTLQNDNALEQLNNYACETCGKRFQKPSSLEFHKLSRHKIAPLKKPADISDLTKEYPEDDHLYCFRCKKFYKNAGSVIEHNKLSHRLLSRKVKAHMSERNGRALCTLCNSTFSLDWNRRIILAHMFKMHNEGSSNLLHFHSQVDNAAVVEKLKYSCTVCGAVLASTARSSHVQMHIKNFISQLEVKYPKAMTAFSLEKCPICKIILRSKKTMKMHLMRHETHSIMKPLSEQKSAGKNNLKLCACPVCKRWFKSEHSLNFHIKKCHKKGVEKSLKSVKDSAATQSKHNVEAVDKEHTPVYSQTDGLSSYICKLCTKRFTSLSTFRSHLIKSHKIPTLNLNNISDFMESIETSRSSLKVTDETVITTPDKNKSELIRPECQPGFSLKLTSSTCINCHICKASIIVQEYPYHLKSVHSFSVDLLHKCSHCCLKFPYPNLLSDHQYQCELDCKCIICDKQTKSVIGLRSHIALMHSIQLSSYTSANFPCELIKVVNDGLPIVDADSRRFCLACGEMFTEQSVYRKHIEGHVTECSVILEDYVLMTRTENTSQADDVPLETGLVNPDEDSMPILERVKLDVQPTGATSDVSANINNDVVVVDGYSYQLLNFLCSTDAKMDSSINVPETDMSNPAADNITSPVKMEAVSSIDLISIDGSDSESSNDTDVDVEDFLEPQLQRKRSSSTELVNDPKRMKFDDTVNIMREDEDKSQRSADNFLETSDHLYTDQSQMSAINSIETSDHFDTNQSQMSAINSIETSDHLNADQSQMPANNSIENFDHFDTNQSQMLAINSIESSDHFDSNQSQMPAINSIENSDHLNADQSQMIANNSIESSDHFDSNQSQMPANNSIENSDHLNADQSQMIANNSIESSDHFDSNQSPMPANNSIETSDHLNADQSQMPAKNMHNFDTKQSEMPENILMPSLDHFNTDHSEVPTNNASPSSGHIDTNQSEVPVNTSIQGPSHIDSDRNLFSALQENFLF